MAGDSRTLKLAILGEVKDLSASLTKGTNEINSFGDRLTKFGRVAGAAFFAATVAAAAYASKLAIDGVKSAIEDEAAQLRLATTLKNVTGATKTQIAAVEAYISQAQLAYGINDNELRPSLDRLVRSTKDVEEAQKLQTLAINIAAGTGKSLQAVSEALAKAHDGNYLALKKLGGGIDENILKSKDYDKIIALLSDTFANQASIQAETFDGKMRRLKEAFGEAKESVGGFILDAITPMVSALVTKVIPAVQDFIGSIGGKEGISNAFKEYISIAKSIFIPVLEGLRFAFNVIKDAVEDNKESFQGFFTFLAKYVAPFMGQTLKLAIEAVGIALSAIVRIVADIIDGFRAMISLGSKIGGAIGGLFGGGKASGGYVAGGTTYLVGEKGPELFTPSGSGTIIPNGALGGGGSNIINITVNGAIDPISTARQITQILNREATLSGTFNKLGASLLVGA
jgi:hypothetical protein